VALVCGSHAHMSNVADFQAFAKGVKVKRPRADVVEPSERSAPRANRTTAEEAEQGPSSRTKAAASATAAELRLQPLPPRDAAAAHAVVSAAGPSAPMRMPIAPSGHEPPAPQRASHQSISRADTCRDEPPPRPPMPRLQAVSPPRPSRESERPVESGRRPVVHFQLPSSHDAAMRLLFNERMNNPSADPTVAGTTRPHQSPRNFQYVKHAIKAGLSAPELADLLRDEHHLVRQAQAAGGGDSRLTIRSMADVDVFCGAVLGELKMQPHELTAASGDKYTAFLLPLKPLMTYLCEDIGLASEFTFTATLNDDDEASHLFAGTTTGVHYARVVASGPPGARHAVVDIFSDGTVSERSTV
jgi:hypothetical protein